MQSTQAQNTQKETDPHDVFAIEQVLAAHAHRAPPLVHDPVAHPAAPQAQVAQAQVAQAQVAPEISIGAPAPQVDATSREPAVSDMQLEDVRPGDLKALDDRPTAKWTKRLFMTVLALGGAIAAAAWQHYGDQAKAMAVEWTPPFVLAALAPSEKPAIAEQERAPVVQAAADQAAAQPATPAAPAQPAPAAAPATTAPAAETTQLQSMAQDLAAMSQQVEELKATIAQLKASQAQLIRDAAKASEIKASEAKASEARVPEAKPLEQNLRPKVTAAAVPPPPRPAAAPVRKPKPAYPPAQAAYVPPLPPAAAPPPPAPPPPAIADDGQPVVRPPMPLR